MRNNSNKIILFNQALKDIENIFRDVGGYDMSYYAENHGKRNIFIIVLIDLKRETRADIILVMKAKTRI